MLKSSPRETILLALFISYFSGNLSAETLSSTQKIRPEQIVTFEKHGFFVCYSKEDLIEMATHALKGEITLADQLQISNGGTCFDSGILLGDTFKVLSVEENKSFVLKNTKSASKIIRLIDISDDDIERGSLWSFNMNLKIKKDENANKRL